MGRAGKQALCDGTLGDGPKGALTQKVTFAQTTEGGAGTGCVPSVVPRRSRANIPVYPQTAKEATVASGELWEQQQALTQVPKPALCYAIG